MRAILLTTTAALLAMPGAALAQAAAPSSGSGATGLAEVVVTAQRQTESLQRAAVAVDVVQGRDLVNAGITSPSRLGELAPALTVQGGSTGNIFFVRGVGNFTVSPNSDPAIAFNYDGIYVGRPSSTSGTFFDLARIEVLKGPQGTLYGRNATGGAINVIPEQPILGSFSGYGTASYGNFDAFTAEGAVNAPLGESTAVRVSGSLVNRDSYQSDGTGNERQTSFRAQIKSELTSTLTARLAADYAHQGGGGGGGVYTGSYVFNPVTGKYVLISPGVDSSQGIYSPASQAFRQTIAAGASGRKLDALAQRPFQNNDFWGVNGEITWDTQIGALSVIPAYRNSRLNLLSSGAGFLYRQHEADEQSSLEMRFKGKRVGIFDYTVGAYGYRETVHAVTALTASSIASFLQPNYTTKSWAPFGRLTANLSDDLRLVGGVRYTDDRKTFVGPTIGGAVVCTAVVAGVPTCPNAVLFPLVDSPAQLPFAFPAVAGAPPALQIANGIPTGAIVARTTRADNTSLKNNKVTYRAAVEYDVSSKSLFYASYETGYRSGGFSPAQGFETFQPEYITAYTVGLKNRFLDNRIQLNLEIFDWEYKNQQVNHVGLDLSGRTANFTQNIGRSRIKGAEVEARALVTPSTLLSADVQYLDTEDIDFVYQAAVGTPGTPPPLTGCAVSLNANPTLYNINCAGKPSYNSPELTINLAAQQTILIQNSKIVIGADTQYKSRQAVGFTYLAEQYAAANWRSNAQIQFGPATDAWSIAAYVRNIEDNRTIVASGLHPSSNVLVAGTTPPLTYGVRLSAKF